MLILLLFYIGATGQIKSIDSTTVAINQKEFKSIIQMMIEFNALQKVNGSVVAQNKTLENIIADKDKIIELQKNDAYILRAAIKDATPAWYNNFIFGFGSAVVILTALILFIK